MVDAPPPPPPAAGSEKESTRRGVFLEFMTKVARLEELVDIGKRSLVKFHQELEYIRRPQIPKESDIMSEIVKSNCTDRMKSYLEAGCSLHRQNISNINQLHSCEGELEDHINKVKALLKELQCLVEDAYGIALTANLSALKFSYNHTVDNKMDGDSCFLEEKEQSVDQLDSDVSFVTVMVLVHNMLKLDYMMQEKIVRVLSLKSSSPELEGYCLMWDLRPYVDDNMMDLAWKMCP